MHSKTSYNVLNLVFHGERSVHFYEVSKYSHICVLAPFYNQGLWPLCPHRECRIVDICDASAKPARINCHSQKKKHCLMGDSSYYFGRFSSCRHFTLIGRWRKQYMVEICINISRLVYKDKPLAINSSYSWKLIFFFFLHDSSIAFLRGDFSLNGYTSVWPRKIMCTEINTTFPPLSSK